MNAGRVRAAGIPTVDLRSTADGKQQQPLIFALTLIGHPGSPPGGNRIANSSPPTPDCCTRSESPYVTRTRQYGRIAAILQFLPLEPLFERLLPPQETLTVMKTERTHRRCYSIE